MPIFSLPCLCLDLHAFCVLCLIHAQIYMLVFRSMSLCLDLCVYVLHAMLMCSNLCWLQCHVLLQPVLSFDISFLAFWPFQWGANLDPVVQAYIHTPRRILKGLDHFRYTYPCFLACFYALCLCQPSQIQAFLCFKPSVGLCLCGCIRPSQGLFRCNHL